jgi:hypothetical protein
MRFSTDENGPHAYAWRLGLVILPPVNRGVAIVAIAFEALAQAFAIKPPREQAPIFHAKSMDGEKFSKARY